MMEPYAALRTSAVDACKLCDDGGVTSRPNGLAVCTHPSPRGVPLPRDESAVEEAS